LPSSLGLAFKAREIEELADVHFFRPLGMVFARGANALSLSPTAVTVGAMIAGAIGGALLYRDSLAPYGVALLVFHGVLDSSDGQLARMTGRTSELGRVLDGVAGYVTHAAIYLAIITANLSRGGDAAIVAWAIAAGVSNVVHAQMYDYHRTAYAAYVIAGTVRRRGRTGTATADVLLHGYEAAQRVLAGRHHEVEAALERRAADGVVREEDRALYRRCFYRPVRGWNAMGDNTRRYAIAVLTAAGRLDWFFLWLALPMNALFGALWIWQQRADRTALIWLRESAGRADVSPTPTPESAG
jgi:phosphatidylglycerophosphate synthase